MLRRVLLAALVCVAVWASGHRSEAVAAPPTVGVLNGAVAAPSAVGVMKDAVADSAGRAAHLGPLDGHAGNPARSTDVWQSARAVVAVQTWRLDGHPADIPAATPAHAARVRRAASPAPRRSPPAAPHTFDLPLLI